MAATGTLPEAWPAAGKQKPSETKAKQAEVAKHDDVVYLVLTHGSSLRSNTDLHWPDRLGAGACAAPAPPEHCLWSHTCCGRRCAAKRGCRGQSRLGLARWQQGRVSERHCYCHAKSHHSPPPPTHTHTLSHQQPSSSPAPRSLARERGVRVGSLALFWTLITDTYH